MKKRTLTTACSTAEHRCVAATEAAEGCTGSKRERQVGSSVGLQAYRKKSQKTFREVLEQDKKYHQSGLPTKAR